MVQSNEDDVVVPIRPFEEEAAIAWLRAQPGGRTDLSDADLGRRWGWNRKRVGRRLRGWNKAGLVTRKGGVTTAVQPMEQPKQINAVPPPDTRSVLPVVPSVDQPFVPPLVPSPVPPGAVVERVVCTYPARAGAMMSADETQAMLVALAAKARRSDATHVHRGRSIPLVIIAYGFFALGVSINVWNALSGGPIANMILPAVMGILAEAVMFFLPARTISLPWPGKVLAVVLLLFVSAFALTNSLRMASIFSADQATARADRQTEGVQKADHALDVARASRDTACGRGLGKTVACQSRRAEVAKLQSNQTQATAGVTAEAKPESTDFADLVNWVSRGAIQPTIKDFDMIWLLFRTFLPQIGGLVLMLARR
jgi:hypothetical protein